MGVTHRYQPFPKPESTTTVDEMNAKLAARVKGKTLIPQAVQSPQAKSALEWEKPKSKDATGLYTTCKRYSCAKVTVNGKMSYELFKLAPGGGWFRSLNAGLDNFLQVQKLAQIDVDKGTP